MIRSSSRRRAPPLSDSASRAAPRCGIAGSGETQWSITGTWFRLRRTPGANSQVPTVGSRRDEAAEPARELAPLESSVVIFCRSRRLSRSIAWWRSPSTCARFALRETCE